MGAWTDAAYFAEKMPTVIFGPGDLGLAHSKEEYVPLDEVVNGAAIILRFLNSPPTPGG
jgi:acetylornithine deacetylase/succinyl-diaminopimelate desuccinylase-like protein